MNFEDLKALEPSLDLKQGEASGLKVLTISTPASPAENSCVFIKNDKFLARLLENQRPAGMFVVAPVEFYESMSEDKRKGLEKFAASVATVDNIDQAMCSFSQPFYDQKFKDLNYFVDGRQMGSADVDPDSEIAQNVFIGEGSVIEKGVTIMPGCVVMPRVHIGAGTILYPNVTIYPYTTIGKQCRIHSQAVIGADGFGYNFLGGEHKKIWHFGGVVIKDHVEIGANTCVDGGSFSPTFIDSGTKIDNFCQIAHNVAIGKHCILCGRAGLAGSVTLEDYVVIGAGGGCAPGAVLKKGTQLAAVAIVSENAVWGPKETLGGHPARPLKEWLKNQAKLNLLAKKK